MSIRVDCLRAEHWVGTDRFPLFIGFMTASQLAAIAEAPQFSLTTDHEVIAGNVTAVPVREWQRPIDRERVDEIARIFAAEAEIMPNAVLLAAPDPTRLRLSSQGAGDLWLLEIPTITGEPKPIWVLDGQHRIAGLAKSTTPAKTPFVLLASHGHSAKYQESTFAKIFAQVTTTAEGLHPLHNEWLTFAFALGQYDDTNPIFGHANARHQKSMETAVHLCHERHLDAARTASNPFFNRVAFNPKSIKRKAPSPQVGPVAGGFQMDATMVERLVFTSYFGHKDMPAGPLTAREVASQIGYAYEALVSCHPGADRARSVFLSPVGSPGALGHRALQEGFLHGVLRHLTRNGAPSDWPTVLRSRAFDKTDWTDKSWGHAARGGAEGNLNK
jgi:DGQHR domain-containing protein